MSFMLIKSFTRAPNASQALRNYRALARDYDATCARIEALRLRALNELQLRPGETVFDIACGTGPALPLLADAVGPSGSVVGVELSPEMAAQARLRIAAMPPGTRVTITECPVEAFAPAQLADALLLCYTHDVLQSPAALSRLLAASRPGARIVIVGMKSLPWLWGWPVNIFNLVRARRYVTTYANLDCPWRMLGERGAQLRKVHTALWGSAYIAVGTLPGRQLP